MIDNKTERMYVVWHRDPNTKTLEDGIQTMRDTILGTGGEYGTSIDDTSRIVRQTAIEYFDDNEFNPLRGARPGSQEHRQAIQEFGRRAVYEVQVRYVGYVNARGKFTETKPKTNRK